MGGAVADQIISMAQDEGVEMVVGRLDDLIDVIDADCEMDEDVCMCTIAGISQGMNPMLCNPAVAGLIGDASDRAQDFLRNNAGDFIRNRASRWLNRGD